MFFSFLLLLFSFFLSYSLFLPSFALSYKIGAVDYPSQRKMHTKPTARAGGLAFFAAFSLLLPLMPVDAELKYSLLLGGGVIFIIGLIDDARPLLPTQKLTGQVLAVALSVTFFPSSSALEGILRFSWIIFLTNAINLCDGLDGLAGGICASQAVCLASISLIFKNSSVFLCAIILLGAILGFLPQNFPRAKIFMGDCGALFLGFALATMSSKLVFDTKSALCFLSVFLVFRTPIYDTLLSILRRLAKGTNPFKADRGHLHHRLLDWGFSRECATLALVTASLFFGFVGVLITLL